MYTADKRWKEEGQEQGKEKGQGEEEEEEEDEEEEKGRHIAFQHRKKEMASRQAGNSGVRPRSSVYTIVHSIVHTIVVLGR